MSFRAMLYAVGIVGTLFAVYLQNPVGVFFFGGSLILLAVHDAARLT